MCFRCQDELNRLYFYNKIQANTLDKLTKAVTLHCCKHKTTVLRLHQPVIHFITELQLFPHTTSVLSQSLKERNENRMSKIQLFLISLVQRQKCHINENQLRHSKRQLFSSEELINHKVNPEYYFQAIKSSKRRILEVLRLY